METLLGPVLFSKKANGEVSLEQALAGKKWVMVYFSAHWCPPCERERRLLQPARPLLTRARRASQAEDSRPRLARG